MLVSVVVPMMNEEGSLPVLERELGMLADGLVGLGHELEVVLVDDGSTDRTAALASELCTRQAGWRLLRHDVNRGFGAGLRTGVADTRGDIVLSYDADCAYPATDALKLVQQVTDGGVDIASATPYAPGAEKDAPALRLLLSQGCSLAYRVALRGRAQGVRTFTCAFRAYRGELVRGLRWRADGFLAAAEILSRAVLTGARVVEVPSSLRPRFAGVSKMRVWRTAVAHVGLVSRLAVGAGA